MITLSVVCLVCCVVVFNAETPQSEVEAKAFEKLVRDKTDSNGVLILTAYTQPYESLFLNLLRNLEMFGLESNVVGVTLDDSCAKSAVRQGLPTVPIKHFTFLKSEYTSARQVTYGTPKYKSITKLKSRIVLRVLKLGVTVIWTDVDVVWLKDPKQALLPLLAVADLAIQSDIDIGAEEVKPPNEALNSGLYIVGSNARTISTFQDIVESAALSKTSEQPSFNQVLCEAPRGARLGTMLCEHDCEGCKQHTTVKVLVLPPSEYLNGSLKNHTLTHAPAADSIPATLSKFQASSLIIAYHNNFIVGIENKIIRQQLLNFWWTS